MGALLQQYLYNALAVVLCVKKISELKGSTCNVVSAYAVSYGRMTSLMFVLLTTGLLDNVDPANDISVNMSEVGAWEESTAQSLKYMQPRMQPVFGLQWLCIRCKMQVMS